jgi:hypothetical protein
MPEMRRSDEQTTASEHTATFNAKVALAAIKGKKDAIGVGGAV